MDRKMKSTGRNQENGALKAPQATAHVTMQGDDEANIEGSLIIGVSPVMAACVDSGCSFA
jgi:hypothetical protein